MLPGLSRQTLRKLLAFALVLTLLSAATSFAQQNSGTIKGTVTDQLGSLVVNANVFVKDAKGVERKTPTTSNGSYEFKGLAAGAYELRVLAPGFDVFEVKHVAVQPGHVTMVDALLSVGLIEAQSVTVEEKGVSTDADRNADAIVLRGRDLDALPNDPDALSGALQALAGPPQTEGGAQIKVDGFSNGQIPPKEAIREVRVNQNPFSAENEYPGWNGIEIFTQPGSDKLHGGISFGFNDESLNSRNPYAFVRAPYQFRAINGNLTGPIIPKRASFTFYGGRFASESNSVVNATVLDPATLKPALFNQTVVAPQINTYISARGDVKLNKKHTLVGNYEYNGGSQESQGIGGFALPSRAFRGVRSNHTVQFTETAVLNEKTINETRLQLVHSNFRQTANTTLPALNVLDSFFGGGAQIGTASNKQDRMELQNFTSWISGNHFIKVGGRLRYVKLESLAPSNFGGTYTFAGGTGPELNANDQVIPGGAQITISSLERYRRTLVFQRQGLNAAQIRNLGGGATQFSLAGGNPLASITQADASLYLQDEWKVRPNFTLSPGLRYENQDNINSHFNFAPRIGFAWSPSFGSKKTAAPVADNKGTAVATGTPATPPKANGPGTPKTVIRGGTGIFYNRISEDLSLQALRFNGVNQKQFVVSDPAVLDLFPVVPLIQQLDTFAQPQTRRLIGADLAPSMSLRSSISIERELPRKVKLTFTYSHYNTWRTTRTVNINAPLAGTYDPLNPTSGVHPLGVSAGNILEYQATGQTRNDSFSISLNGNIKKFNFWSAYSVGKTKTRGDGTSGSSFDPYDLSSEWGRSNFDIRQFFYANGGYQGPRGFSVNGFLIANSGTPFNITTGHDTNGDTFFTERPAFATDLSKPGVIVTPFGAFDPNPTPGQRIIPRNFGQGPKFLSVNVGVSKTFKFGRPIPPKTVPAATASTPNVVTATGSQKPPPKQAIQRPYSLSVSLYATNALNHTNEGNPVGNMASPYFLKSTGSSNIFFFGPGGGGSAGNRQITLRVRFSF
jgi:hypothetical protein